ncbi:MAG: hypothetical protein IT191_00360 [Microbacteriaceae bacterium]|nr:hypothetical protein [Microbacteriaceae bacterium]
MTSITLSTNSTNTTQRGVIRRIVSVAKLHLVNTSGLFGLPLFILFFISIFNLLVAWLMIAIGAKAEVNGAGDAVWIGNVNIFIIIYMLVVAVQSINLTFPFAQGYSVTRKDFYRGSIAAYLLLSLAYGALLTVLAQLEQFTSGWWLRIQMYSLNPIGVTGWLEQFFVFFAALLFFFFLGAAAAGLYVRFRTWGMALFFSTLGLLLLGVIAIPLLTNTGAQVLAWFAETGAVGLAAWSLIATLVLAIIGSMILRRATAA